MYVFARVLVSNDIWNVSLFKQAALIFAKLFAFFASLQFGLIAFVYFEMAIKLKRKLLYCGA